MKATVLLVDDEAAARHGLKRALEPLPCTLVEAADGEGALERIEGDGADIVVCDIRMPRLDGL